MPHFETLELLLDLEPHSAAVNMAMDEIILEEISVPTLRTYRWLKPAVSFGYFEKYAAVENQHSGRELVRRWTGGGVVLHGEDVTYSIMAPRDCFLSKMKPAQSYLAIHELITETMRDSGLAASLTGASSPKISTSCFENAVSHDVLVGDRKIAGAAQRRTQSGLLHQGSIQGMELPRDFTEKFAAKLSANVIQRPVRPNELAAALTLAETKYVTPQWMRKF
jgi:lipoate-protein ligase A